MFRERKICSIYRFACIFTDINCVSYIQVKYNKNAYKNGDIMAQISLKEKYDSQWKLVEFIGPNADTKYACLEPSVSVDVIEAKVFADKKYILNTDGNLGLNVAEPKRTIDVKGQIKTSSNNNYNSSNLNDGDLVIYDDKSFENYFIQNSDNFNQHTYTRFKFLSPVQLKYNSNILRHNSNGAQPLIIPEVGLGDNILFMFKDVNNQNNIEFLVKQIIGCDTDGQLIMESEILETDISTIIANSLVDLFLIKKDGFTNKTLSVNLGNNKILEGSEMKFTKKFVEGDKIIILFQDDVITRRIQKVKNDLQIELTKSILSTKPILGFIPVPAQFIIQNNEGKTNIMVDDSGSLIFASNDSDLEINAIEMSVEKGKMEILSNTVNSITNQPGIDNYSLDGNFLKLQGNLKIEGQSKFTNDLFICTNQPGLSEPDITSFN